MEGRVVYDAQFWKKNVCISCYNFNHWHLPGEPCDIRGCECTSGNPIPPQIGWVTEDAGLLEHSLSPQLP